MKPMITCTISKKKFTELVTDRIQQKIIDEFDTEVLKQLKYTRKSLVELVINDKDYLRSVQRDLKFAFENLVEDIIADFQPESIENIYYKLLQAQRLKNIEDNKEMNKEAERKSIEHYIKTLEKAGYKVTK